MHCETASPISSASSSGSSSSATITPIVVAVAGAALLIVIVVLIVRRRRQREEMHRKVRPSGLVSVFQANPNVSPSVYGQDGVFLNPAYDGQPALDSQGYGEISPYAVGRVANGPSSYNHLALRDQRGMSFHGMESSTDFLGPAGNYLDVASQPASGAMDGYFDIASKPNVVYSLPSKKHGDPDFIVPTADNVGGAFDSYNAPHSSSSRRQSIFSHEYMGVSDTANPDYGEAGVSYYAPAPGQTQGYECLPGAGDGGYTMVQSLSAPGDGGYAQVQATHLSNDGGYTRVQGAPLAVDGGYTAVPGFYSVASPSYAVPMEGYGELPSQGAASAASASNIDNPLFVAPPSAILWLEKWLYPQLDREAVEAALSRDGMNEGKFLVRRKESDKVYALSAVYKGKVCHHLIVCDKDGWHVNGFAVAQCKTLEDVVEYIRLPRPNVNQPQELTTPVHE